MALHNFVPVELQRREAWRKWSCNPYHEYEESVGFVKQKMRWVRIRYGFLCWWEGCM